MITVTLAFDTDKTEKEFRFSWIFNKLIVPAIKANQCLWYEIKEAPDN